MKRKRLGWGVSALLVVGVLFGLHPLQEAPSTVGVQIGEIARDFTVRTLGGQTLTLRKLRGRPVWLNFFASWCPPCRREAPTIERVARQNPGLVVIGMDLTGSEVSVDNVRRFVQTFHITYPVALDPNDVVATQYEVEVIPTSYFVDSKGVIRAVYVTEMNPAMIRAALQQAGYRLRYR